MVATYIDTDRTGLAGRQLDSTRELIEAATRDYGPSHYARYRLTVTFRDRLLAGVPKDPELMTAWLRKNLPDAADEEIERKFVQTLIEMGVDEGAMKDADGNLDWDSIVKASEVISGEKKTNGFKMDDDLGLYYEGRCLKAAVKECANVVFSGNKWGPTRKGTKNYFAERVFIEEDVIPLGRTKPDGVEQIIGHVSSPQGDRSTLTRYEYVEGVTITFNVLVFDDCVSKDQWQTIFDHMCLNGLGAARSQGHGRVSIDRMVKVPPPRRTWVVEDESGE